MKNKAEISPLEQAIQLAVIAHQGQVDKGGKPYILHLFRVMNRVETEEEQIVAVLHDIVEDTSITLDDLEKLGFSERVLDAIRAITHDPSMPYSEYIEIVKQNPIARRVKIADLLDNMDIRRLPEVTQADLMRLAKYREAWKQLQQNDHGDA